MWSKWRDRGFAGVSGRDGKIVLLHSHPVIYLFIYLFIFAGCSKLKKYGGSAGRIIIVVV